MELKLDEIELEKGTEDIKISKIKKNADGTNFVFFKKSLAPNQSVDSDWFLNTDNVMFNNKDFSKSLVIDDGYIVGTMDMKKIYEYYMEEEFDEVSAFSAEADAVTEENIPEEKIIEYLGWWIGEDAYINVDCENDVEQPEGESFIFGDKKDSEVEVAKLSEMEDVDYIKINYINFNSVDLLDDVKEHFDYDGIADNDDEDDSFDSGYTDDENEDDYYDSSLEESTLFTNLYKSEK